MVRFTDRREAGRILAEKVRDLAGEPGLIVLGLPRGGVPVAFEIAAAIEAPLDVFAVRKIGAPGHEELAIGALASGGIEILDYQSIGYLGISLRDVEAVIAKERRELERREQAYRDSRPSPDLAGRTIILVDDGLATGSTMLAAVQAVKARAPRSIVVAVPVASAHAREVIRAQGVDCRCVTVPEPFVAVGAWYRDFEPTTDAEVRALLNDAAERRARAPAPA